MSALRGTDPEDEAYDALHEQRERADVRQPAQERGVANLRTCHDRG